MDSDKTRIQGSQSEGSQKDAVIRAVTYHRRDFDLAAINLPTTDHEGVRKSMLQISSVSSASLGQLDCLPLEIILEVCAFLDIQSLFRFSQVNTRARQIVSVNRGYREIMTHTPEVFCAILRTKVGPFFTLPDLLTVLYIRECLICGAFGGFIFLPTFLRCCFACISSDSLPDVIRLADAERFMKSNLTRLLKSVPVVKAIPGIYSMDQISREKPIQIVAKEHIPGLSNEQASQQFQITNPRTLRYMVTMALPFLDIASGIIQNGVCCSGCQVALEEALRNSRVEDNAANLRDKVYSNDGYMEHFRECRKSQELWNLSQQGFDITKVSEFVRRRGSFNQRDAVMSFGK